MKRSVMAALSIAAMLGIGGGAIEARPAEHSAREPAAMPGRDEIIERVIAKSNADQERKKARRKARWASYGRKK